MFAGPNGSGKSTIKGLLRDDWLGVYINADEIEASLRRGMLDLSKFQLDSAAATAALFHLKQSPRHAGIASHWEVVGSKLLPNTTVVDSYWASSLADFIRSELLKRGVSFSFETVMSHPDKVALLHKAQSCGYRTYLYYVATADAEINISRVKLRVAQGGHNVPEQKIRERYVRSLSLLHQAVSSSHRAYIYDNSGDEPQLLAEAETGVSLKIVVDVVPAWFYDALFDPFLMRHL